MKLTRTTRVTYALGWIFGGLSLLDRALGVYSHHFPSQLQVDWKSLLQVGIFFFVASIATAVYSPASAEMPAKGKGAAAGD